MAVAPPRRARCQGRAQRGRPGRTRPDRLVRPARSAAGRPPDRHRRAGRHAGRHHARGAGSVLSRPAGGGAGARRRPARAVHPQSRLRRALGGAPAGLPPAREPARRRARLPARERLGAAGPAERDEGDVRPLRRRAARRPARSPRGGAATARASRRSLRRSRRRPSAGRGVLVGSYPSFEASGPEVEVVLKSSDPDLLAEARAWLESELDRLT